MLLPKKAGVAAGLLVVLAAAGCGVATPRDAGHPVPGSVLSDRSSALAESQRLAHLANVPSDATVATQAPVPALRHPVEQPGSSYLLDTPRWWTLPMSMAAALTWLRAHPPSGLIASGTGSGDGPGGANASLSYRDRTSAAYNSATLVIEVVPAGSDASAVRADGQVLWVPPRSDDEVAPIHPSRGELLAYRGATTNVLAERTLTGAAATKLARLIDALSRDNRDVHGCAMDTGFRIRVTFIVASGPLVFTEWLACDEVNVTSNGHVQPGLIDSPALGRVLRADLGPAAS
jgi:hypothetical protein